MKTTRILCVLTLALASSWAVAQPPPGAAHAGLAPETLRKDQIEQVQVPSALYRLATVYKQGGDYERLAWTLQRLTALQPNAGELKLALATTYALQGRKTPAYDVLLSMQKQGYGYDLAKDPNFAKIADTRVWTYIADGLKQNLQPFGEGKIAFTLPRGDTLIESLAYDPKRTQWLAGSVREGKIDRVDAKGKLTDFITPDAHNGLWSVYAMAVDAQADALYVASTASVYFKGFSQADYGKAGVFKFSLSSGKLLDKYLLLPDGKPRTLSSIAVGRNGAVFAADGLRNIIYRLDGGALKPMVGNPRLTSLRGLAVSADGKRLYFADYTLGVFGVDLAAGKGFDLKYDPAKLALGGIDGLYCYDQTLVVIQNGMSPHRVMRLHLSDDGRSITRAVPLDAGNAALKLPTYGAIEGDGLYFVANSQKNQYGTYGTPKDATALDPVNIFRSNLRYEWKEGGISTLGAPPRPVPLSSSKPGSGRFGNVYGGSESVTGN